MDNRFYTVVQVIRLANRRTLSSLCFLLCVFCFSEFCFTTPAQVWHGTNMVHHGRDQEKVLEWVSKVTNNLISFQAATFHHVKNGKLIWLQNYGDPPSAKRAKLRIRSITCCPTCPTILRKFSSLKHTASVQHHALLFAVGSLFQRLKKKKRRGF